MQESNNSGSRRKLSQPSLPPVMKSRQGGISLRRNLKVRELPDNLQELSVRGASQIVNGKPVEVEPRKILVSERAKTVRINIRTGEPVQGKGATSNLKEW